MKILMFSDLHLDEATKDLAVKFLNTILLYKDFDGVFFLGDLFEKKDRIPNILQRIVIDFIDALQKEGKFFYALLGNHDGYIKNYPSAYYLNKFGDNVKLIVEPEIKFNFLFLPYTEEPEKYEKLILNTRSKYCLLHNEIKGYVLPNNHKIKQGIDLGLLLRNFLFVFAGHYHTPKVINNKLFVLGNCFPRNFTEATPYNKIIERGFYVFDTEQEKLTFIPFASPFYVKILVKDEKQIEEFNTTYKGKEVNLWLDFEKEMEVNISKNVKILSKIETKMISETDNIEADIVLDSESIKKFIKDLIKGKQKEKMLYDVAKSILEKFGISLGEENV